MKAELGFVVEDLSPKEGMLRVLRQQELLNRFRYYSANIPGLVAVQQLQDIVVSLLFDVRVGAAKLTVAPNKLFLRIHCCIHKSQAK